MGWNGIRKVGQSRILEGIADNAEFLFCPQLLSGTGGRNGSGNHFLRPEVLRHLWPGRPVGGPFHPKKAAAQASGCWPISMPGAREKIMLSKRLIPLPRCPRRQADQGRQVRGAMRISAILLRLPGAIMKKARMKSFFYDITASAEGRGIFLDVVERVDWLLEIFIPFQRWRRHLQCCRDEGSAVGWR